MILNGIGSKKSIADKVCAYFPPHHTYQVYYEPFFLTGSVFFHKKLSKYNYLNDLNEDVFNFWQVLIHEREAFETAFRMMPMSEDLFCYWKETWELTPVMKALRFLMLSNFSLKGKGRTFLLLHSHLETKERLLSLLDVTHKYLNRAIFRNKDFRDFFKSIKCGIKHIPASQRFTYNDPPYLGKSNTYMIGQKELIWQESDLIELIDVNKATKMPFAISEQDSRRMRKIAKVHKLQYTIIGDKRNLDNRATEILMTNYPVGIQTSLFEYEKEAMCQLPNAL